MQPLEGHVLWNMIYTLLLYYFKLFLAMASLTRLFNLKINDIFNIMKLYIESLRLDKKFSFENRVYIAANVTSIPL